MKSETVYDPETGEVQEVIFDGLKINVKDAGIKIIKADPEAEKTTQELIEKIEKFLLANYKIKDERQLKLLAHYVLVSYFFDKTAGAK